MTNEKQIEMERLPKVFTLVNRDGTKFLTIVYKDRVEDYKLERSSSKAQIDKENGENCSYEYERVYGKGWNAWHEVNVLKNSGYREVHAGQKEVV